MTDDIKQSLKERSELTKSYYKNGQQLQTLLIVPRISLKLKMITLINSKIFLLLLRFTGLFEVVYSVIKKIQQYHHCWLMANVFQIFVKRQIFLIVFFINTHTNTKYKYFTTIFIQDKCQNNFISCY